MPPKRRPKKDPKAGKKPRKKKTKNEGIKRYPDGRINSSGGKGAQANALRASADTPVRLLKDIANKRIDTKDLTVPQRRACLMVLANGSQTSTELANLFQVSPSCIRMDLKKIRDTLGREVKDWTMEEVLGDMVHTAEKVAAQAMKREDIGLAWSVKRDMWRMLKDWGVVGDQKEENRLTLTIDAIGEGYERARLVLGQALDPRLTGEVIDVSGYPVEPGERDPVSLPLPETLEVPQDPEDD